MSERISQINSTLDSVKNRISDTDEQLFHLLPSDVYTEVKNWVAHAYKSEYDKCRSRQQNKFQRVSASDKQENKGNKKASVSPCYWKGKQGSDWLMGCEQIGQSTYRSWALSSSKWNELCGKSHSYSGCRIHHRHWKLLLSLLVLTPMRLLVWD